MITAKISPRAEKPRTSNHSADPATEGGAFSPYQIFVIAVLTFLQFTIILDFMIISPLGAVLMPALHLNPAQFGTVVSVYAFSAGLSGLLAGGFADRFDRKNLLLFFYFGFLIGTVLCGLARSYEMLIFARIFTGLFGGVIGSIVLAITADLFSFEVRGRVMGYLQTAFSASQVLGIPLGIYVSNQLGWNAPFFLIVGIGFVVGVVIALRLRPINEHLRLQKNQENIALRLLRTLFHRDYTVAFALTALLSTGGFMLMPFGSAFAVNNLKISLDHLPIIYLVTGIASIVIGPLVGQASDRYGKLRVFLFGCALSALMVTIYTHLHETPMAVFIVVNVILFVSIYSRMIPSQALNSALPDASNRGSFMAVSSSLQQLSGGLASVIAGQLVTVAPDGSLVHFERVGYVIVASVAATAVMMYFVNRKVQGRMAAKC